jgi:hypothetical protein
MTVFKIPQGLLGGDPLVPVRLERVAQFDQGGLGGHDQPRGIAVSFPRQEIGYRIGRRGGAIGGVCRSRRGRNGGEARGRDVEFRTYGLWRGGRRWRRSGRRLLWRRDSEQRGGMTLTLQDNRVNANADKSDR